MSEKIAESLQSFGLWLNQPNVVWTALGNILEIIGNYFPIIFLVWIMYSVRKTMARTKELDKHKRSGFKGLITNKIFVFKNHIKVFGTDIGNTLEEGDIVIFDRDIYRTKFTVVSNTTELEGATKSFAVSSLMQLISKQKANKVLQSYEKIKTNAEYAEEFEGGDLVKFLSLKPISEFELQRLSDMRVTGTSNKKFLKTKDLRLVIIQKHKPVSVTESVQK